MKEVKHKKGGKKRAKAMDEADDTEESTGVHKKLHNKRKKQT